MTQALVPEKKRATACFLMLSVVQSISHSASLGRIARFSRTRAGQVQVSLHPMPRRELRLKVGASAERWLPCGGVSELLRFEAMANVEQAGPDVNSEWASRILRSFQAAGSFICRYRR